MRRVESHCVDADILGASKRPYTGYSSPLRVLEHQVDAVGDGTVVDFPDKDDHVSFTAAL